MVTNKEIESFLPGPNQDSDRRTSAEVTKCLKRDFEDVFNVIEYFDGMFLLQVKPDSRS